MTCKECFYDKACGDVFRFFGRNADYKSQTAEKDCKNFLYKENVIVLPCKVGDKVAVRACCECVTTIPDNDECRYICPFEDDCECEDCDNSNERIFMTEIDSVFNNGFGWKVTFKNLSIIEASIEDIETSFFVGENAEQQAKEYEQTLKGGCDKE